MLATLSQRNRLTTDQIRNAWYTGMFDDGKPLQVKDQELADHCLRWSCLMARQYQRYAIELLLWCFEDAIKNGNRSIEAVIEYWERRSQSAGFDGNVTFEFFARGCAGRLMKKDDLTTSQAWNEAVHGGDERFEFVDEPRNDNAVSTSRPPMLSSVSLASTISSSPFFFTAWAFSLATTEGSMELR